MDAMDTKTIETPDSPLWHWASSPGQAAPVPFGIITEDQLAPALRAARAIQRAEIEAIASNPAPATFANTIEAMERSGRAMSRLHGIFEAWTLGRMTETLAPLSETMATEASQHQDAILFDERLFRRVQAVHAQVDRLGLSAEDARLVEEACGKFKSSGAGLSRETQNRLSILNARLGELSAAYGVRLLAEREAAAVWFDSAKELAGLGEEELAQAAQSARDAGQPGRWRIDIKNSTQHPCLAFLHNRTSRQRIFEASLNRSDPGDPDSAACLASEIAALRAERAGLLGQPSHAHHVLQDQMVHTPQVAMDAVRRMADPVMAAARRDFAELQSLSDAAQRKAGLPCFQLQPWDLNYYDAIARRDRAGFDAIAVRRHLQLDKVLRDGVFATFRTLYGIEFKPAQVEVMTEGDEAFEVIDHDGKRLGLCYFNPHSSPDKQGGAWMMALVQGTGLFDEATLLQVSMNLDKPAKGSASLDMDDAVTLFHEFGHALHALFSRARWPSLAGTNTAVDFVELPSMAHERMVLEREVFEHCLRDCGDPSALHAKVVASDKYHRGFEQLEYLEAAALDLAWHSQPSPDKVPSPAQQEAFEHAALRAVGLDNDFMPPRYRSGYFSHAFGWDYDAKYYAYLWSNILANDAAAAFRERGGLTRENGEAFRKQILEKGNTCDPAQLYVDWRGQEADPKWLMQDLGLATPPPAPASHRRAPR